MTWIGLTELAPEGESVSAGWIGYEVVGPLAHDVVGILSKLSGVLAEAGVPIFVFATYDTDVLLVPESRRDDTERSFWKWLVEPERRDEW